MLGKGYCVQHFSRCQLMYSNQKQKIKTHYITPCLNITLGIKTKNQKTKTQDYMIGTEKNVKAV